MALCGAGWHYLCLALTRTLPSRREGFAMLLGLVLLAVTLIITVAAVHDLPSQAERSPILRVRRRGTHPWACPCVRRDRPPLRLLGDGVNHTTVIVGMSDVRNRSNSLPLVRNSDVETRLAENSPFGRSLMLRRRVHKALRALWLHRRALPPWTACPMHEGYREVAPKR